MNGTIFGIGPLEVLVVGILVLLVFGPERLPELTRGLGTALRRLRETYVSFTSEFKGELEPIASEIDAVTREIRQEVDAIREAADIRTILKPYAEDINKAVKLEQLAPLPPPMPETPAVTAAASTISAANTIAPPRTTAPTNGAAPKSNGAIVKARPAGTPLAMPALVDLPEDNPWASVGAPVRSDRLDDDSPWRA